MKVPDSPTILIKARIARKNSKHAIRFILVSEVSFIHSCVWSSPFHNLVQYLHFSLEEEHAQIYPHSVYATDVDSLQRLRKQH